MTGMLSGGFGAALQISTATPPRGRHGALLAVDDEPAITASIADQLHRHYHVLTAGCGEEALATLRTETVSVILTDQRMPGMTGVDLLARVAEEVPDVTRLLVTGYSDIEAVVRSVNEGKVYYYLSKPWRPEVLDGLVSQAFEHNRLLRERRALLEELRQANTDLESKVRDRTAELVRSNKELEQFAYVASHDLQEPLRMVSSYTKLLSRRYKGRLDADADEFIAYAVDGAKRMQTLINDLLAYSRLGTRGKEYEPTDCTAVFDLALANLKMAIEESGAVVVCSPLPTVIADKLQFGQLLQNLIGNALKYHGDEPPRVHITAEQKGHEWVFSVRDNGIGIDPRYAERIFVIFQRLHTREERSGTGIGLAICKKIVERHGGRIWVESQVGSGATFYFTIPIGNNGQ